VNVFSAVSLTSCLLALLAGILAHSANPGAALNRVFSAYCAAAFVQAFAEFMARESDSVAGATAWYRVVVLMWPVSVAVLLHLSAVLRGRRPSAARRRILELVYVSAAGIGIAFAALLGTPQVGVLVREPWGWGYARAERPVFLFVGLAWALVVSVVAFVECTWGALRAPDPRRKAQNTLATVAVFLPLTAGGLTEGVLPALGYSVPQLTTLSIAGMVAILGYAVWKYELFVLSATTAADRILATMTESVVLLDPQGRIADGNDATWKLAGYSRGELVGSPAEALFGPELEGGTLADSTPGDGSSPVVESTMRSRDGREIPINVSASVLRARDGQLAGLVLLARDMTEQKRSEARLRESEEFIRATLDSLTTQIAIVGSDGRMLYANVAWKSSAHHGGFPLGSDRMGFRYLDWLEAGEGLHSSAMREIARGIHSVIAGANQRFTMDTIRVSMDVDRYYLLQVDRFAGRGPVRVVVSFEEVTERKQLERASGLAYRDQLTGLPNRVMFGDRLKQELARAQRQGRVVVLLLTDIDRFEHVNENLGHELGDQLLKSIASRLSTTTRRSDTVLRMGGDEFAVIASDVRHSGDVDAIARRVMSCFDRPFQLGQHELHVTASIGVAVSPAHGEDSDTLSRSADIAAHRARTLGGGRFEVFARDSSPTGQAGGSGPSAGPPDDDRLS
jgi:diguanylate cyclase (GGDEF)-like protein/PAS domain S-box-containing protein